MGAVPTALVIVVAGSLLRAPLPGVVQRIAVAAIALVFLLREFRVIRFQVPQNARLVPQFVTRIPFWGAVQFGAEMGTGMRTYSPTGLPHIVVGAVLFLASWPAAVLAGVGFAFGRTLMLLSFAAAKDRDNADVAFDKVMEKLHIFFALLTVPLLAILVWN